MNVERSSPGALTWLYVREFTREGSLMLVVTKAKILAELQSHVTSTNSYQGESL